MAGEFWLDEEQWTIIAPLLPFNQPGAHRTDESDDHLQPPSSLVGPGIWQRLFEALVTG
ncbi:hypothetical protein [Phyllobacterium phragmitis]|uniref:hypothetical protein n=1 Tax=Phyllobacterium phragmitis TaxID=2670329 RepID=UPI0038B38624